MSYVRMSWWIQKVIPGELEDVYQMWQQPGWMPHRTQKLESSAEPASGPNAKTASAATSLPLMFPQEWLGLQPATVSSPLLKPKKVTAILYMQMDFARYH